jgi:mono/diheme cytochrome c family protein
MIMRIIVALLIGLTASQATTPAGPGGPGDDVAKGKEVFERTGCWQCHGRQGQGGSTGPRIASPVPMNWQALSTFVRTSRRSMPPYTEKVLSNQELADVYAYLRSIPPAPDFKTIPLLSEMIR